ncbi:accessory factor UbiK family protein [Marinobacterium rhizophilum]|uniref:Ubiquinone biosynthesis accessory factor UbiK n=1 Tax=Marinobacterium rhizophilum TaxID=420402 RepID=A0ABY5HEA9_9GAMM|nr:accessory factor UbiK family protein [Marinobacterium rhizophilum]UTW10695.1 accessory factor UbiK family protein [Marinobacterium rhizophilum]
MLNQKLIETVSAQLSELFEGGPGLPGQEAMRQQVRSVLQSSFARLDLVTRDEFDAQAAVLGRTREKVDQLELKLGEIEQRLANGAGE